MRTYTFSVLYAQISTHLDQPIWQAARAKDVFGKYVESVLAKSGKLRSLITELQKNYPDDVTAKKLLISIGNMKFYDVYESIFWGSLRSLGSCSSQGHCPAELRSRYPGPGVQQAV